MTTGDWAIVAAILFLAFKETIMGQVYYAKKRTLKYVRKYWPIVRMKLKSIRGTHDDST